MTTEHQVTLEDVKICLNIDLEDNYYDSLLSGFIVSSLAYIIKNSGKGWINDEYAISLAKILQMKFVVNMFENRGTEIPNSTKRDIMVTTILEILASFSEEE